MNIVLGKHDFGYLGNDEYQMMCRKINGIIKELVDMCYGRIHNDRFSITIFSKAGEFTFAITDLNEECWNPTCSNREIAFQIKKLYEKEVHKILFRY